MKSSLMRPALVLALALGLASCGGKAEFAISGTVTGLQYPDLVLSSNGMDLPIAPPATAGTAVTYSFPKQLQYGDEYHVVVTHQPKHQVCIPVEVSAIHPIESGVAGQLAEINVPFACGLDSHTIGGTVTGLTADGLVLANGSTGGTITLAKAATAFTFGNKVTYGVSYGVTVLTQPAGLVCSVGNGTGVMGDDNVTGITVSCVPQA